MVKSYLRYVPEASYGVILTSGFHNGVKLLKKEVDFGKGFGKKKCGVSISGESILIIDLITGIVENTLKVEVSGRVYSGEGIPSTVHYVTSICEHPNKAEIIASGYSDGSVRMWNIVTGAIIHVFHGHGKNITAIKFCRSGNYLSCGSFDTEVTLWDTLSGKGLYRFSGHLNEITDIEYVHKLKFWNQEKSEFRNKNVILEDTPHLLITSSKDCTVKIWNIQSQICLQTLIKQKGEVYSILLNPLCNRLYTAGSSGEISIYRLTSHATGLPEGVLYPNDRVSESCEYFKTTSEDKTNLATYYGGIPRFQGNKYSKVTKLIPKWSDMTELDRLSVYDDFHGNIFAFTNSNTIEAFAYFNSKKIGQRIKKMVKRRLKDSKLELNSDNNVFAGNYELFPLSKVLLTDEDEMVGTRLLGVDFDSISNALILGLGNNSIKYASFTEDYLNSIQEKSDIDKKRTNYKETTIDDDTGIDFACRVVRRIEIEGHRGIPREICVSDDEKFIATFGDDSIKVWNMKGFKCVRTIIAENPVCGFIIPGNEYTISGTRQGSLQLHDIVNCKLIQSLDNIHDNSLQSIALSPDNSTFVSVAQDKKLNLYYFGMKKIPAGKKKTEDKLSITLSKTLALSEEGLAIKYTHDGKYIIVSLLDNTIMVLYSDTLKQFLVLYGHSLPVSCLDVSHDNTILASGSADKTIKIWGLDFGNIQRSFHAHTECVTHVKFLRETHYLVSTARDGSLKIWDLDKGELITILHQKSTYGQVPIVSLALSYDGDRIICGFLDRSLRVWFRTDQQLFLEEEREKEQEEHIEREILQGNTNDYIENAGSISTMLRPTRKTFETLKSTEKLMEVIDIAYNYYVELVKHRCFIMNKTDTKNNEIQPPNAPLEIGELSIQEYILSFIQRISYNYLTEVVWSLPLLYAEKLLVLTEYVLKVMYNQSVIISSTETKDHNKEYRNLLFSGLEPLTRIVLSLVQTHFLHWVSSINTVSPIIDKNNDSFSYSNDWSKTADPRNERLAQYNIRSILFNLRNYIHFLLKNQMDIVSINNGILKVIEHDCASNNIMKELSFNDTNEKVRNKQTKKRRIQGIR
ncbi:11x WD40 repeats containing protein of plant origin [Cryptosporidium ryanae]|uniref:11x WD40 repeats containing protein of plant origin n=1 Tax=Cryptosporidium ryanae TaxID=515981 RepID=UPI00351AB064|nr:11x WD40 repeats containing protein of plant origin [Cryptosporidium ryanae]